MAKERSAAVKRTFLVLSLMVVLLLAGLAIGCSSNSGDSTLPDGAGGGTGGKAQALVFSTPT